MAEISTENFEKVIGGSIEETIKKNEGSHEKKMMKLENPLKNESRNLNLNDFICAKKLGKVSLKIKSIYLKLNKVLVNLDLFI